MTSDSFQKLSSNKSVTNKRGCLDLVYISFEFNAFMLKLDQSIQKKKGIRQESEVSLFM